MADGLKASQCSRIAKCNLALCVLVDSSQHLSGFSDKQFVPPQFWYSLIRRRRSSHVDEDSYHGLFKDHLSSVLLSVEWYEKMIILSEF
jgi:hypothetical protein